MTNATPPASAKTPTIGGRGIFFSLSTEALSGPKVNDLLTRRVRDALVGQGEHAENDQGDADESHRFHGALLSLLVMPF